MFTKDAILSDFMSHLCHLNRSLTHSPGQLRPRSCEQNPSHTQSHTQNKSHLRRLHNLCKRKALSSQVQVEGQQILVVSLVPETDYLLLSSTFTICWLYVLAKVTSASVFSLIVCSMSKCPLLLCVCIVLYSLQLSF